MDFLGLGIDISSWDASKEQTLQRFIALFTKLETFDGKTFNPILGGGLAEFNTAATTTTKLLDELNEKLKNFKTNADTSKASTTGLTEAEKLLAKQTADYNALLAKMNALTTDQAKANMAAKLELSLMTKQMLEQAKAGNATVQQQVAQKKSAQDLAKAEKDAATAKRQANLDAARAQRDANVAQRKSEADAKANMRAMQEEAKAVKALTNDLLQLKQAFKDQSVTYANNYINKGANHPQTKDALADLNATGAIIGDIDSKIQAASGSGKLFGGILSDIFGQVRMLAYILPGLGIAGIFNLAFEAIGEAVKEMGFFNDEQLKMLQTQTAVNKSLNEEYQLLKSITDQRRELFEVTNVTSARSAQALLDKFAAGGLNKTSMSGLKVFNAQTDLNEAQGRLNTAGDAEAAKAEIKNSIALQTEIQKKIVLLDNYINTTKELTKLQEFERIRLGLPDFRNLGKADLERRKAQLELDSTINQDKLKNLSEYVTKKEALDNAIAENTKQIQDDELNKTTELAKDKVTINQEVNRKILADDISSYNQKRAAIIQLYNDQVKLNAIELSKTTSLPGRFSQSEIDIAKSKAATENATAKIDQNKKLLELDEEYHQRLIKAETEINKSLLNEEAVKNERIANNQQNSLDERLKALAKYFKARQDMQDLEEQKDLSTRALKAGGKVPAAERAEIVRLSQEQKANIVADTEKKVYDIVYQSTQKQLKLVKDTNALENGEDKAKYTEELRLLNESFENKEIKYKEWKKRRAEIDNQYSRISLIGAIKDDKADIDRLEGFIEFKGRDRDAIKNRADQASDAYSANPNIGTKQDMDTATGEYEAFNATIFDADLELSKKKQKLADDELKLQLKRYEKETNAKRDMLNALQQIEQAVYDAVKTIGDEEYNQRIERSKEMAEAVEEQYDREIDAVEKSTLSNKDKTALDIQLNAQRTQAAKNAEMEQKKIAHDKAEFDKELAISHILLSTAVAVAELLVTPWLAVAAGVAGGAALAKAASVQIPSYEFGTDDHPGGLARFGEAGVEKIKEPYKSPYYVMEETIGYLPKGTVVTPIDESPNFPEKKHDEMMPFIWLARQLKPKPQKNYFNPTINVDLGFEQFKFKKLYGK